MNDTLQSLRSRLDEIDSQLLALLSERFRVTHEVGMQKRNLNMPAQDIARERLQFNRIEKRADELGLDADLMYRMWRLIIDEVIKNHESLRQEHKV